MLRFFSAFSKSWFGPLIMGLLLVAFGVLGSGGIRGIFSARIADAVVSAGSHVVTQSQFQKMFARNEEVYQQRTGQPYPLEEAVREGVDKGMLQDLAAQSAYAEMLTRAGIRPTDEVVAIELRRQAESGQAPGLAQVFDSVTGKFRPQALQALLQSNGLTINEFQSELADSIADDDFQSAVKNGFEPPRIYAAVQATLLLESRDVTYFVIPAASVPVPAPPTDAQLNALIQQYRDKLMLPERRKLTVVRFSAKALEASMPVTPAAVEQQFEAKKADYAKPELRSLVEIPLNDPKTAPQVQAALARGEDPQAVAKSVGVDAVTYADQPESAIADRKAAAAAFQMKAGQVSGPVQGDFKTVILKVTKITPAQAPDINAAKAQIEADLRQTEALDKVYDLSQKFEDLRQGGASVADAAAKVGAPAVTVGPVTADGKDLVSGQPNPILSQKLLATAFQLPQGGDSDVEQDTDKGDYYAVHVDQVIPPSPPSLDEKGVRQFLTQAFYQQAVVGGLQKKADAAQAALKKGQTFEAVAATYGAHVAHQVGLQEATAQQYEQTLGGSLLEALFQSKVGQVFAVGSDPLKGFVIGRVDAAHPADPKQIAGVLELLQRRIGSGYLESLQGAVREASAKLIKPRIDLDLAHTAMGVDAAMAARAAKPAAGGAGPAS